MSAEPSSSFSTWTQSLALLAFILSACAPAVAPIDKESRALLPKASPDANIVLQLVSNQARTTFYVDGEAMVTGRRVKVLINNRPHTVVAAPEGYRSKEEYIQPPYYENTPLSFTFLIEDKLPQDTPSNPPPVVTDTPTQPEQLVDRDKPDIIIFEPAQMRGIRVAVKKRQVVVRGRIVDRSPIVRAAVNETIVHVDAEGGFQAQVFLSPGTNTIVVEAEDAAGNLAVTSFPVEHAPDANRRVGRYIALIIGIDQYEGAWDPLQNAVHDAQTLADVLGTDYGFDEVITLYDQQATRENILRTFERLSESVAEEDNVLIYYAGHGQLKEQMQRGFWVPVNATSNSIVDFIANSYIRDLIRSIPSRHTLLVADACFAGDVFRSGQPAMIPHENSPDYFEQVQWQPSRKAITSGGIEPVMDGGRDGHSVFAYYLLQALRNNREPLMDAYQLFDQIRRAVISNSQQTPDFRPIMNTGDQGGQFVFQRR